MRYRPAAMSLWLPACLAVLLALSGTTLAAATAPAAPTGVLTSSAPAASGEVDTYALVVGGVARSYRLFVPTALVRPPARLVVVLHSYGITAATTEQRIGFDGAAAANGSLVAYPEGLGQMWNAGTCCGTAAVAGPDDVAFLDAVLDDVEARYPVAPSEVAVGGYSNGAMMAYRYACVRSSRVHTYFAGSGVPVAPTCPLTGRVAVLHVHGMLDQTVPWAGTTSSPLTPSGVLPPVAGTVSGLAARSGCTGWRAVALAHGNTRHAATGCPAGTSFDLVTAPTLAHTWSTSTASPAHLDETGLAWAFLLTH